MNIGFIGLGKLGMPVAVCMDLKGHNVIGFDLDKSKMSKTNYPFKEVGRTNDESFQDMLIKSNVDFASSIKEVLDKSELVFVAIQTPHDKRYEGNDIAPKDTKDFNYAALESCLTEIVEQCDKNIIISIISTVSPGTYNQRLDKILAKNKLISYCYNPYFIAMGTVVKDFLNPEFVLLGTKDQSTIETVTKFYKTIHDKNVLSMDVSSAEIVKMAYNTMIGLKITFANNLMEMCHKIGGNVDDVTDALKQATDRLISTKYLTAGMGDGGGCLLPNNIIFTEYGPTPIEDIEAGDKVLSNNGKLETVLETYKRPYKGKVLKIKCKGLPSTYYTLDHKFLVYKDKRQKYITNGIEKKVNNLLPEEYIGDSQELKGYELNTDFFIKFPKPLEDSIEAPDHVNKSYLNIAGYYLSEGSLDGRNHYKRITFSLNQKEQEYFIDIENSIKSLYPNAYFSRTKKISSLGEELRYCNTDLSQKLYKDFGKGCIDKFIPNWILYGKADYAKYLLKGLWRGDGSSNKEGFNFSTTSKHLAYGVYILLKKLDIISNIQYHKARISKKGLKHKEYWEIRVRNAFYVEKLSSIVEMPIKHKMQNKKYSNTIPVIDNNSYHKILSIEVEEYEGTVWNMNIENTHQYVCSGGIQPNCHPRDNIALSDIALKYKLSSDLGGIVTRVREQQADWLTELMIEQNPNLPKYILGTAFKPETNIETGSPAILCKNILLKKGYSVKTYEPNNLEENTLLLSPGVYLIGCKHEEFKNYKFPEGSIIIDPHRYIPKQKGIKVIYVGVNI